MRVLCADVTADETIEQLTSLGHVIDVEADLKAGDLARRPPGL